MYLSKVLVVQADRDKWKKRCDELERVWRSQELERSCVVVSFAGLVALFPFTVLVPLQCESRDGAKTQEPVA